MTTPLYELRSVTKTYGGGSTHVTAVRDVSFSIAPGEFVAVAGPSGSGKTTLLQLLGGLDRPTAGEILFEGVDFGTLPDTRLTELRLATIGFVFQHFNLIPTMTAADNVALAVAPRRVQSAERDARVAEVLEAVGLAPRAGHLPSQLSGGEQQRVAIARALANEPRVLLADEPTGNLDSETGGEIVSILRRLRDEREQTVVLVTHDDAVAAAADRTIRMHDGGLAGPGRRESLTAAG